MKKLRWFAAGAVCYVALIFLLGAAAPTLYVPWTALRGTNQVNVVTNPATGTLVIGPATPISTTASNAAFAVQVWTNTGTSIEPSPAISTVGKPLIIGDGVANPPGGNIGAVYTYSQTTNKDDIEFSKHRVNGSSTLTGADEHDLLAGFGGFTGFSAVNGYWYAKITNAGGLFGGLDFNDRSGIYNMVSELATLSGLEGTQTDFGGETMGFLVYNQGGGVRNTSIGIHALQPAGKSGTQTNIGMVVSMRKSGSGPYTGLLVESYLQGTDTFGPNYQPAIAIFDSRQTGLPILQARGTNGAFIALEVTALKTTNATPLDVASAVTAQQGNFFPLTVAGAGNGNTNYTLLASRRKMYLGSSNVNVVATMQTTSGQAQFCSVSITNLSAINWGVQFQQTTNRIRWWGRQGGGTNQPTVLTNNTELRVEFEWNGTNGLGTYEYFSPGL